jgi:integrase
LFIYNAAKSIVVRLSCFSMYTPGIDSKAVTLMIRFKDADGTWKRRPAARGANGRVKPGFALIDGRPMAVHDGTYDLRFTVDRKTVYPPVGDKAAAADTKRQRFELKSAVKAQADEAGVVVIDSPESKTLKATAAAYIDNKTKNGFAEAAIQATLVTAEFMRVAKCARVDQVTQEDFFRYHSWLRKNQCGDRTVSNKHMRAASWLRFAGIDPKQIPPKPRYELTLPDMYTSAHISALLDAAEPYNRILILLGLKCGLRDQELMHVEFSDINWEGSSLRVRSKPQYGFGVKTWEQRNVPVPGDLLEELKRWQKKHAGQSIILGTKNKKPNTKLLLSLKRLAWRAGLNCGRCKSCLEHNQCQEYTLHRFRRTYITKMLRALKGDVRTVMAFAGHKDIASTMRYLVPESAEETQTVVNSVVW